VKAALAGRSVLAAKRTAVFVSTLIAFAARPALAQTNGQLWGNITLDWVRSDKLTFELDVEPKVLVDTTSTKPGWWNVDENNQTLTPNRRDHSYARSLRTCRARTSLIRV
jgi:hypothetical protein